MPNPSSPPLSYYIKWALWIIALILFAIFMKWCPSDCDPPPPPNPCEGAELGTPCPLDPEAPTQLNGTCSAMATGSDLQCN